PEAEGEQPDRAAGVVHAPIRADHTSGVRSRRIDDLSLQRGRRLPREQGKDCGKGEGSQRIEYRLLGRYFSGSPLQTTDSIRSIIFRTSSISEWSAFISAISIISAS